ncbi:hypothetical protein FEM03_00495 [Phragmitibacter flavus]|uniref:Uncharacterized protein n=1 Tax=Phragmitibacter flavus TaxID=2576071 RepID=A0A5R8KLI4_9BACT|nr:hypothetical protein [Phragmitibacter flavus]TLD72589.1 hypothetical protein FEM03_00495 [Phragmitibacter flavus]
MKFSTQEKRLPMPLPYRVNRSLKGLSIITLLILLVLPGTGRTQPSDDDDDGDNDQLPADAYGAPPVTGPAASPPRPKLARKPAVKNLQADPALIGLLQAELKKKSDAIQFAEWEAAVAIELAEKIAPNGRSDAWVLAAKKCDEVYAVSLNNSWCVRAAECYRKSAVAANYDIARALLLSVLNTASITTDEVSAAALELRELAITNGYTLNISAGDLKGCTPGVAKIFSTPDKKMVNLTALSLLYNAAELFRENGDNIWAAQMYRACLNKPVLRGQTEAGDQMLRTYATKALANLKLGVLPKHPLTKSVNHKYVIDTKSAKPTASFLEEVKPVVNVWASISGVVEGIVFNRPGLVKRINEGDIQRFKDSLVPTLGVDYKNYRALFLQSICELVVQRHYPGDYPAALNYCRQVSFADLDPKTITKQDMPDARFEEDLVLVDFFKKNLSVEYLKTDLDRAPYKLKVEKGLLMCGGVVFDTQNHSTAFSGKGWAIYVVSPDGEIFAGTHKVSLFHHSSFLSAADVAGAGEIKVDKGILIAISNKSGHYFPGCAQLAQSLDAFQALNASLAGVKELHVFGVVKTPTGTATEKKIWPKPLFDFRDKWAQDPKAFDATFKSLHFINDPFAP